MVKSSKFVRKISGVIKITSKPMGFVVTDESRTNEDIVVYEENLNCALDRDTVEIEIISKDHNRKKGRVLRILKRNKINFVGVIEKSGSRTFFKPDDPKFYREVDLFDLPQKIDSDTKVLVEVYWTNQKVNPKGKILKIIGKKGEHETEMQSILLDKGIVYDFPPEVEFEANELEKLSKENKKIEENRRDFRNFLTFTIDPIDAKDFDDALSYQKLDDKRIRVGVHIADVSHFVKPGTALDKEARKRGFSIYLVDRTIPMLPEILSNNLCSLVPGKDRLAFSVVFDIERNTGRILDRWFGKTIINSNKRFSYEEAQQELEAAIKDPQCTLNFRKELNELNYVANIYREENKKNGAIEFENEEVKFELDKEGKPIKIYKKPRLDTMKMVEEWMLLANREVAKYINDNVIKKGGAGIFRIHDSPKIERMEELAIFVRALGHELPVKSGQIGAKDINILLKQIEGHSSESLIKIATIRSMSKAIYSTKNIGHFGLAFEYYTHFTSPIRRYPDLVVHRILSQCLGIEDKAQFSVKYINKNNVAKFEKIAMEASEKEIIVAEAERDSIKYKQVEFMQDKIGIIFDGVISGVTEWGIYVENPENKVEGMVRLKDIKEDNFVLDEKNYCIVGERSGKKYSIGDSVRAELVSVNLDRKTLDFKLVS